MQMPIEGIRKLRAEVDRRDHNDVVGIGMLWKPTEDRAPGRGVRERC